MSEAQVELEGQHVEALTVWLGVILMGILNVIVDGGALLAVSSTVPHLVTGVVLFCAPFVALAAFFLYLPLRGLRYVRSGRALRLWSDRHPFAPGGSHTLGVALPASTPRARSLKVRLVCDRYDTRFRDRRAEQVKGPSYTPPTGFKTVHDVLVREAERPEGGPDGRFTVTLAVP